jgi:hypothetical protein
MITSSAIARHTTSQHLAEQLQQTQVPAAASNSCLLPGNSSKQSGLFISLPPVGADIFYMCLRLQSLAFSGQH